MPDMKDWYINSYGSAIHVSIATSIRVEKMCSKWHVWAYFYSLDGRYEDSSIDKDFLREFDTEEEAKDFIARLIRGYE